MYWLESAPIFVVGLAVLGALGAAHEIALRLARRAPDASKSEARAFLVSSALALLGLLLGFTFSSAQDRFRIRQSLVVAEANALGTSYLRLQLLPPPARDELSRELVRYAQTRVRFTDARTPEEVDANGRETSAMQDRIWRSLVPAIRSNPTPSVNLSLLQTMNDAFDRAASRRAASEARIPVTVLRSLLFCCLMVAAIIGYTQASERRDVGVLAGVLLLLSLAFCLILDLDRPVSGSILVNDAPLRRAVADMQRSEAAKLSGPPALGSAQADPR